MSCVTLLWFLFEVFLQVTEFRLLHKVDNAGGNNQI